MNQVSASVNKLHLGVMRQVREYRFKLVFQYIGAQDEITIVLNNNHIRLSRVLGGLNDLLVGTKAPSQSILVLHSLDKLNIQKRITLAHCGNVMPPVRSVREIDTAHLHV